jgi:hypothetical protein
VLDQLINATTAQPTAIAISQAIVTGGGCGGSAGQALSRKQGRKHAVQQQ